MGIKKYLVQKDSLFNKKIILSLCEDHTNTFEIEGYEGFNKRALFNYSSIRRVGKDNEPDPNSFPVNCVVVYLNDLSQITALVLEDNKHTFYSFRVDPQKPEVLKLQSNYVGSDLNALTNDYETSGSRRKNYEGVGDFSRIKDLDYFENFYDGSIKTTNDKKYMISRLFFENSSLFITDFAKKVEKKEITLTGDINGKEVSRDNISKLTRNRKDCLIINEETKQVEYVIYTFKPLFLNRYYLFKKIDDSTYEFLVRSVSFNKLFAHPELKEFVYKEASKSASHALVNVSINEFYDEFIEFIQDEVIDEDFIEEYKQIKSESEKIQKSGFQITKEVENILIKFKCNYETGFLYFPEYEVMPLGFLDDNSINLYETRDAYNEPEIHRFTYKRPDLIEPFINELLTVKLSSRLLHLISLIDKATIYANEGKDEQISLIKEIEDNYKLLWKSDRQGPSDRIIRDKMSVFSKWKEAKTDDIARKFKDIPVVDAKDVSVTIHGALRISERINDMSDEEKLNLAKVAYAEGKTPWHFYDSQNDDFKVLSYLQSKHYEREIKLYNDVVFVFQREAPHNLITCFPYEHSFKNYMRHERK